MGRSVPANAAAAPSPPQPQQEEQQQASGSPLSAGTAAAAAASRVSERRLLSEMFNSDEYVKKKVLIEEVKKRPFLFKKSDPSYSEKVKVHHGWVDVSNAVGWDEDMCRSKWRNIRDGYRKIQRYRLKHPEDTTFVNKHPELSFLDSVPFTPRSFKTLPGQYFLRDDGTFDHQQLVEMVQQPSAAPDNGDAGTAGGDEILPPATTTSTMSEQPGHPVILSRTLTTNASTGQQCPLILIDNAPSTTTATKRRQPVAPTSGTESGTKIFKIAAPVSPAKESVVIMQMLQDVQRRCSDLAVLVQKQPKTNNVFMTLSNMIEELPMERRALVYGKIFQMVAEELNQHQAAVGVGAAATPDTVTTKSKTNVVVTASADDHSYNLEDEVIKAERDEVSGDDDNDDSLFSS